MPSLTLKATATITGWKEEDVPAVESDVEANRFTRLQLGATFKRPETGAGFEGQGDCHALMIYGTPVREEDGSVIHKKQFAVYQGIEVMRISFDTPEGKTVAGSLALKVDGKHVKNAVTKYEVIPESVTGDFVGLVLGGTGGFSATSMQTDVTLELELA